MKMIKTLLIAAVMLLSARIATAGSLYAYAECSTPGTYVQDGTYGDYTPPYNYGTISGSVWLYEAAGGIATATIGTIGYQGLPPVTYTTQYLTAHNVNLPCDEYVYIYAIADIPSSATNGFATSTIDIYW